MEWNKELAERGKRGARGRGGRVGRAGNHARGRGNPPAACGNRGGRGHPPPQQSVACKFFTVDFLNSYLYLLPSLPDDFNALARAILRGTRLHFDKVANTLITRYLINSRGERE